jgi:hypothetical protein
MINLSYQTSKENEMTQETNSTPKSKTWTNGNREVEIAKNVTGKIYVQSSVFDGVKWQYGSSKKCLTFKTAEKAAKKQMADISMGWTQDIDWTVKEVTA